MRMHAFASLLLVALVGTASAQVVTDRHRDEALRHYRSGEKALRSEAYADAEREFHAAVNLDPLLDLAHYGLGQVYMATRRYPAAVRAYLQCREAFFTNAAEALQDENVRERRIDDHIRALEEAKAGYEMGIAKTANTQATILRLDMQIKQLRYQRHRGAERPEGTPAWISLALGSAYFRTDAMPDAEREYREALRVESNLGEAHNNLAVVCMLTGRYSEAEQELQAAEKAGFRVNPEFKHELSAKLGR